MKIKAFVLFICLSATGFAAPYARWNEKELILNNGIVQRIIQLPSSGGQLLTTEYKPVEGEFGYFVKNSPDFQFEVNGVRYAGDSQWTLTDIRESSDSFQGNGADVVLQSADKQVELTIRYLLYPDLPVIRKNLVIKNNSAQKVTLESVDVEKLTTTAYHVSTYASIYSNYGRRESVGPYKGDMQDALVITHHKDWEQGVVIGNEAPGVTKRTSLFWQNKDICSGLTHKDAMYPFLKWLSPGDSFITPQVFTMVYNHCKDPNIILNTAVPDFVRKHLGTRLSRTDHKPTFVYNTWEPFRKEIDEKLVMELAKAAADAGMKEFIIDDGWQDSYGDWGIDKKKFPNGLKPVFDYIKSLGMKPGIWVSIGTAAPDSRVYRQHPEWFVEDSNGKPINLQTEESDKYTACFGTGWNDYIKGILRNLLVEHGIEYLKLDFAIVTSPYIFDCQRSGCYSTHHEGHMGHRESLYNNYEYMWKLFDELHEIQPELFIDCTFETMGGLQLIDYAMLKHAEGNWLSNFNAPDEKYDLRVRQMSWWRSPAIPSTALVIGNPKMEDKGWQMHIKSLAGTLPIMLGDPRKLSGTDLVLYRQYADWLQAMETRYDIMSFRQDLLCLGEPREGHWDGFQRINTETGQGGIIGVFRHGAKDSSRIIFLDFLDEDKKYRLKTMDGDVVATATGREFRERGFSLTLPNEYDGKLFEIEQTK